MDVGTIESIILTKSLMLVPIPDPMLKVEIDPLYEQDKQIECTTSYICRKSRITLPSPKIVRGKTHGPI